MLDFRRHKTANWVTRISPNQQNIFYGFFQDDYSTDFGTSVFLPEIDFFRMTARELIMSLGHML